MAGAREMIKFLCQNANIVTREENSKVAFESHFGKKSTRTAGKQTNKQKQNKGPAKKVLNFKEASGDIRVPIQEKERKMS